MTHAHSAVDGHEAAASTSSSRLLATLGGAGALAGLLIVLVWRATTPAIAAHRASVVQAAIAEVLHDPARWDTLYLANGALTKTAPSDGAALERVYRGFDATGRSVGFALQGGEPGFVDVITVMFAIAPATGRLLGMKVLAEKETPGLGDKIRKDSLFVRQFTDAQPPLKAVKAGNKRPPSEVDAITGATISSRAVVRMINKTVERWQPLIAAYLATEARP